MLDVSFIIAGTLTGFIVGMTGVGGGALMTPILLLVFSVPPSTAIATDLWFAAVTKLVGATIHHDAGQVDWQIARRLWLGSLPTALTTVQFVSFSGPFINATWLTHVVGAVVLVTALGLLFAPKLYDLARGRRLENPTKFKRAQPTLTIAAGAVLGVCVALTSVGAGALGSVMLLYLYPLRMTPHRLVATDMVHAMPLALAAGTGYLFAGVVDWWMLLSMLIGSIPAITIGSLLARRVSGRWIQLLLSVVLLAAGVKTLNI